MAEQDHTTTGSSVAEALALVAGEHASVIAGIDPDVWARAGDLVVAAPAVFTVGSGRSGLALQMAAMRFMHLGLAAHVVGETTTPAIGEGDVLVAASGSGTTTRVVQAARTARDEGASVVAITTAAGSPLAELATLVLVVPAADKEDFDATTSQQYAGSLFEQMVLVLTDALFQVLWTGRGIQAQQLWRTHANLE